MLHATTASAPEATHFQDLPLASALQKAVAKSGYTTPTPIQEAAIPLVLEGRDVLGCAQTGTGKTAAFALPILQQLMRRKGPRGAVRALVLAPTRELAAQIGESFTRYAAGTRLRSLVVFGGVGKAPQIQALRRGIEILVATPGRLLDLESMGEVRLDQVEHVVLDEADRMLDMGFVHDIRRVMAAVPERRQTLLFSATLPPEIEDLGRKFLHKPTRIAVDPISSTGEPIAQSVYLVESKAKTALLVELLQDGAIDRALIFTRTKHGANRLAQKLSKRDIPASAIHGNKSQSAREKTLAGLKSGETRVVVATDLASRGLDVKGLSHVVNYDLPNEPESYVHRVGRTGRAGESGIAVSLCSPDERPYLKAIEKLTGKTLTRMDNPLGGSESADGAEAPAAERRPQPAAPKRRKQRPTRPRSTTNPEGRRGAPSEERKTEARSNPTKPHRKKRRAAGPSDAAKGGGARGGPRSSVSSGSDAPKTPKPPGRRRANGSGRRRRRAATAAASRS